MGKILGFLIGEKGAIGGPEIPAKLRAVPLVTEKREGL